MLIKFHNQLINRKIVKKLRIKFREIEVNRLRTRLETVTTILVEAKTKISAEMLITPMKREILSIKLNKIVS